MRNLIFICFFMFCVNVIFAQSLTDEELFDKVENLSLKKMDTQARKLLQYVISSYKDSVADFSYRYSFASGLFAYYDKDYERSISILQSIFTELDNTQCWNCDKFLRVAFYLSDSFLKTGDRQKCEEIINYSLIKCADSYDQCLYSKRMYQELLVLYGNLGDSHPIIEQIHNEIQKLAINSNRSITNQRKESFSFFYNYNNDGSVLNSEDSLYMDLGKGMDLYLIEEDVEAIRLLERAITRLTADDPQLKGIYEGLLIMYSRVGRVKSIDLLLPRYHKFCEQQRISYDPVSDYTLVGYTLAENGHNEESTIYYERCDSILNTNYKIPNWLERKKHTMDGLIYNYRTLGEKDLLRKFCENYADYIDSTNFEEYFYINYYECIVLSSFMEFQNALLILNKLKNYIVTKKKVKTIDEFRIKELLAQCHLNLNHNNKSLEYFMKSLQLYKENEMNDNSLLSSLYLNIGRAFFQNSKYKQALPYFEMSAEIQKKYLGIISEDTQKYISKCKNH